MANHRETHPVEVAGCFGCKALSISYGDPPSPQGQMESRWNQDMPAYQRLRSHGLQPKAIDGCATLERHASDQMEVEMGHLFSKGELSSARTGMELAKAISEEATDAGMSLVRPPPT